MEIRYWPDGATGAVNGQHWKHPELKRIIENLAWAKLCTGISLKNLMRALFDFGSAEIRKLRHFFFRQSNSAATKLHHVKLKLNPLILRKAPARYNPNFL